MSVKHVLVPQVRYQALLSAEEKYLCVRKQQSEVLESEEPASIPITTPLENPDVSPDISDKEEEPRRLVQGDLEDRMLSGEGEVRSNVKERELTSLRPPGIPSGSRGPLKKWMTWGNSAPKK